MTQFSAGNRIALLRTGDEYFPALAAAIDAARAEIHLETYIFADDPTGTRIARALAEAARRGVAVRVLVDGFGADNFHGPQREMLEQAGAEVLVYRPEIARFRLRRHRLRRMHRKLVVVDGAIGFCGGINVHDDRDGKDSGLPRFDFAVRVEGPIVADMQRAVTRLWQLVAWTTRGRPPTARDRPDVVHAIHRDGRRAAFLTRDNLRNRRAIEEAYLDAIAAARRDVLIACAYFLPGPRFRRALADAAGRGVRVRLLLQGLPDHVVVQYASTALYGQLMAAGIEIHQYFATYLHAKVAVVDGRWSTVGSSNIDPFSLLLSREANVVIDDAPFAGELADALDQAIVNGATSVQRDDWSRKPLSERALARLALWMARMLTSLTGYARGEEM